MKRTLMAPIAVVWLVSSVPPVAAIETTGSIVADAFLRVVEAAGYQGASAREVERVGESTILRGVEAGEVDAERLSLGAVMIDAPLVNADNELLTSSLRYEDVALTGADGVSRSVVDGVALRNVTLGASTGRDGIGRLLGEFEGFTLEGLVATSADNEAVSVAGLTLTLPRETGAMIEFSLDGLVFSPSLFEPEVAAELAALGYDGLALDMEAAGRFDAETGSAEVAGASLGARGMGTLVLNGSAEGLRPESFVALQAGSADFARVLTALETVSVSAFSLSYRDAGLTERLLALTEERTGLSRTNVVRRLVEALEPEMADLDNPAFSQTVTNAVRDFLSAPGEVTVRARPQQSVSALQIISAAVVSPGLIPQLLAIEIETR